jgi:hypothetical protein
LFNEKQVTQTVITVFGKVNWFSVSDLLASKSISRTVELDHIYNSWWFRNTTQSSTAEYFDVKWENNKEEHVRIFYTPFLYWDLRRHEIFYSGLPAPTAIQPVNLPMRYRLWILIVTCINVYQFWH